MNKLFIFYVGFVICILFVICDLCIVYFISVFSVVRFFILLSKERRYDEHCGMHQEGT
jgi:hypothetical protein